jgi:hypothetical protein
MQVEEPDSCALACRELARDDGTKALSSSRVPGSESVVFSHPSNSL